MVIVLVDAEAPFEEQDTRIADLVEREGRAIVIGINKVDLVERQPGVQSRLREIVDRALPQIKGVPVVTLSARTGEGLDRLMTAVMESYAIWNRRVPTAALNRFLSEAVSAHPPPAISGRRVRLDYITQPKARPPTFVLFSSRASCASRDLSPLSGQRLARSFCAAGHAGPAHDARQGQSICRPKAPVMESVQRRNRNQNSVCCGARLLSFSFLPPSSWTCSRSA